MSYQGIAPALQITETNPGDIVWNNVTVSTNSTTIVIDFSNNGLKEMYVKVTVGANTGMTFTGPSAQVIKWIGGSFPGYQQSKTELWKFVCDYDMNIYGQKLGEIA